MSKFKSFFYFSMFILAGALMLYVYNNVELPCSFGTGALDSLCHISKYIVVMLFTTIMFFSFAMGYASILSNIEEE